MKKMLILILITTLLRVNASCPPVSSEGIAENLKSKSEIKYRELVYIEKLRHTIRKKESAGNYTIKGASGEFGAYQFMGSTYKKLCMQYFGDYREPSRHNQDTLAFCSISNLVNNRGYSMDQIAAFWNSGDPNSRRQGINKKGVPYNVGAYVNDFRTVFNGIHESWPEDHYNLFLYLRSNVLIRLNA